MGKSTNVDESERGIVISENGKFQLAGADDSPIANGTFGTDSNSDYVLKPDAVGTDTNPHNVERVDSSALFLTTNTNANTNKRRILLDSVNDSKRTVSGTITIAQPLIFEHVDKFLKFAVGANVTLSLPLAEHHRKIFGMVDDADPANIILDDTANESIPNAWGFVPTNQDAETVINWNALKHAWNAAMESLAPLRFLGGIYYTQKFGEGVAGFSDVSSTSIFGAGTKETFIVLGDNQNSGLFFNANSKISECAIHHFALSGNRFNNSTITDLYLCQIQGYNLHIHDIHIRSSFIDCFNMGVGQLNNVHLENVECQTSNKRGFVIFKPKNLLMTSCSAESLGQIQIKGTGVVSDNGAGKLRIPMENSPMLIGEFADISRLNSYDLLEATIIAVTTTYIDVDVDIGPLDDATDVTFLSKTVEGDGMTFANEQGGTNTLFIGTHLNGAWFESNGGDDIVLAGVQGWKGQNIYSSGGITVRVGPDSNGAPSVDNVIDLRDSNEGGFIYFEEESANNTVIIDDLNRSQYTIVDPGKRNQVTYSSTYFPNVVEPVAGDLSGSSEYAQTNFAPTQSQLSFDNTRQSLVAATSTMGIDSNTATTIPLTAHGYKTREDIYIEDPSFTSKDYSGNYVVNGHVEVIPRGRVKDLGGGVVGIPMQNHGRSAGDLITLRGTILWDGNHTLQAGTTLNMIAITATYTKHMFRPTDPAYIIPDANTAVVDKGGGKVGFAVTGHNLPVGHPFQPSGTANYDSVFEVDIDSTANEIVVVATYVAETLRANYTIDAGPAVDKTGGNVGIPMTANVLVANDFVTIAGSTLFSGHRKIVSRTANEIVIEAAYGAGETFAGTETVTPIQKFQYVGILHNSHRWLPFMSNQTLSTADLISIPEPFVSETFNGSEFVGTPTVYYDSGGLKKIGAMGLLQEWTYVYRNSNQRVLDASIIAEITSHPWDNLFEETITLGTSGTLAANTWYYLNVLMLVTPFMECFVTHQDTNAGVKFYDPDDQSWTSSASVPHRIITSGRVEVHQWAFFTGSVATRTVKSEIVLRGGSGRKAYLIYKNLSTNPTRDFEHVRKDTAIIQLDIGDGNKPQQLSNNLEVSVAGPTDIKHSHSHVYADSTSNVVTVTLPLRPAPNQRHIVNGGPNAGTNTVTVERNGKTINGIGADDTITTNYEERVYRWSVDQSTWLRTTNAA